MAGKVSRRARPPRRRVSDAQTGYLYTAEAVRLLGLDGADYAQVRALLRLVRPDSHQPGRRWARFDLRDLASLRVVVGLAGGSEALVVGRRLRLGAIRRAAISLRHAGYEYPFVQVAVFRLGNRVVASANGVVFEPVTGQIVMDLERQIAIEFKSGEIKQLRTALARERALITRRPAFAPMSWPVSL